jgi:hypothetical protein
MAAAAAAAAAMANSGPGFNAALHHSILQKQNTMSSPFFLPAGMIWFFLYLFISFPLHFLSA